MACSIEEIERRGLEKVEGMIKGKAKNIVVKDNVAVFGLQGKKIKTKEQAMAVAKKKQQAIEKWSEDTFGNKAFGGWTNLRDMGDTVALEFGFPKTLLDAYKKKIENEQSIVQMYRDRTLSNEYVYGGQVFSSLEDMQSAMEEDSDMLPEPDPQQTNFTDYIVSKKALLEKVNTRLETLLARRKYERTKEIKKEIAKVREISKRLEKEVYELLNTDNIFEKTISMFNSDLEMIEDLLSEDRPAIEDIHTAEFMLSYFALISDYSSRNTRNDFVNTENPDEIDPEIRDTLDKLRGEVTKLDTRVFNTKKKYLLDLVNSSTKLKSVFPGKQAEEIRDELLRDQDDIGVVSQMFGTIDKQFTKEDSLLGQLIKQELEGSRSNNKSYVAKQVQKMNALVPKVKKKLLKMGYGISNKPLNSLFSEVSYDLFHQKTENGNRTGRLISPYSDKWYKRQAAFFKKINESYFQNIMDRDWEAMNKTLEDKYNWLNENTDFFDLTKIPELANDPRFERFGKNFAPDASYRQEIIDKIGQHSYDRLVEDQAERLEDYVDMAQQEVSNILDSHGVDKFSELPESAQHSLNITLKRNSPFEFIHSHKTGQKGRVDYTIGNTGNQYQSHLKYNSHIPKSEIQKVNFNTGNTTVEESGYLDKGFEDIKNDSELLEFWEILNDSVTYMNMTLSDSSKRLVHNSLPHMEKFTSDILLDKDMSAGTKISTLLSNARDYIGNLFSTNIRETRANDIESINKSNIVHIQDKVNLKYKTELLRLKKEYGAKKIPKKVLDELRENVTNQVVEEQAFNLPVVMRAYLDMVAEYKSQKDSLPKISVFKNLYESINLHKKNNFDPITKVTNSVSSIIKQSGVQDKRMRANKRMDHWFNKNIMNLEDKEYWVRFGKFYNKEERKFKEALEEEQARVKKLIDEGGLTEAQMNRLEAEYFELRDGLENLGQTYTLAEIYNTTFNKFAIFLGLAWNVPSNMPNRVQGWYAGAMNDTGKYWTAGNFPVANRFISRKGLRYIPGNNKYKNEIKKTRLFIDKLNIIQDATNEIDRARNDSGFTGIIKKLNPFYLTEYTEWHNQTPQILSMLMDQKIKDKDGNEVSIFDGTSFPAHRIDEHGEIVLRPEFATKANLSKWENFSDSESADVKSEISDVIAILNGDYSRTGSTYIKSSNFGRTLMTFKTWLPNQIWQRFAYDQKNLALGKERFDGIYTGSFISKKTNVAATALFVTGFAAAGVMGLGIGLGGALAIGAIMGSGFVNKKAIAGEEEVNIAGQLAEVGLATVKKMIGLPANVISGKNLVKAHEFNKLGLSEAEKQNLNALITEIVVVLGLALTKVMIKAASGPNDEDEPKTLDGKTRNPYYGKNSRSEQEKMFYNFMENQLTRTISDITLYTNPDAMYTSMSGNSMIRWFDRIRGISGAVNQATQGLDQISTGPNAGESRLLNQLQRTFVPSIGQGMLGFEKMLEQEYVKTENMDSWFYTDYKKDRKKARLDRTVKRSKLEAYWKSEFNYNNESPEVQEEIDKLIKKLISEEIEADAPYPERFLYDDEQQKIGGN